jgi:hypothetical protein
VFGLPLEAVPYIRSRNFFVAAPDVISSRQGWLLHHDAVFCAAVRIRSMVARGTGSGLKARQENRDASRSSRTSIGALSVLRSITSSPLLSIFPWSGSC